MSQKKITNSESPVGPPSVGAMGPRSAVVSEAEARILMRAFARLDAVALGIAVGITCGTGLALATLWLVVKGGPVVGPGLAQLRNYFPGFSPTPVGALLGFLYAFVVGFGGGWLYAVLWNLSRRLYIGWVLTRQILTSGFLDNV